MWGQLACIFIAICLYYMLCYKYSDSLMKLTNQMKLKTLTLFHNKSLCWFASVKLLSWSSNIVENIALGLIAFNAAIGKLSENRNKSVS